MKALLRKKWVRWLLACITVGMLITPLIIVTRTWFIVHPEKWPSPTMGRPLIEKQNESFTCGYHALSMLYRAYGLDPEQERIRWRLGVDTKAVFWEGDSTGALHPDVFMVLGQDYFQVNPLDVSEPDAWSTLMHSLDAGWAVVLLISRRENGNLHWVLGTKYDKERLEIFDSLKDVPYFEDHSLLAGHTVSAILVSPKLQGQVTELSSIGLHLAGIKEMKKVPKRLAQLKKMEPQMLQGTTNVR